MDALEKAAARKTVFFFIFTIAFMLALAGEVVTSRLGQLVMSVFGLVITSFWAAHRERNETDKR